MIDAAANVAQHEVFGALFSYPGANGEIIDLKPLIAAVEGYALAGGCEVVLACDLVTAGRGARFGLPETRRGLAAAAGGLALINSLGQIAGFVSPFLVGWIKDATNSTDAALYILSSVLLLGAILVLRVPAKLVNR